MAKAIWKKKKKKKKKWLFTVKDNSKLLFKVYNFGSLRVLKSTLTIGVPKLFSYYVILLDFLEK